MEVGSRPEHVCVAWLGVEEDVIRSRGVETGYCQVVLLLVTQAVLLLETIGDRRGVFLHVAWGHVVRRARMGGDSTRECRGIAVSVD